MPRRRTPKQEHLIEMVIQTKDQEKEAYEAYHRAQDAHLDALRAAREHGETLENLAEALDCSKQWIHKWTTFGREHNRQKQPV
jgi:hypothetical protein